jgi:hypothetical protein
VISGSGTPVAEHLSSTVLPSLITTSLLVSASEIAGGTVYNITHISAVFFLGNYGIVLVEHVYYFHH